MKATIFHVITSLGSGRAERMLKRLVLADRGPRAFRQVVISLTDGGVYRHALRDARVELHCLGLGKLSRLPGALFRLIVLMRSIRPDVVMTWLYHAHFIGTLAAITSGIGARRVVWNLSCSNPNFSGYTRTTHRIVMLLAWLSPLPWAIASGSRSGRRAHEALGYRPRRWFRLPNGTRKDTIQRALESYRQLWRFATGIEPLPVTGRRRKRHGHLSSFRSMLRKASKRLQFGGQFRRRWRGRFGRVPQRLRYRRAQLRRLLLTKTTFIAVTGSCGKSTTVRLAADMLTTGGPCYCLEFYNVFRGSVRTVLSVPASSKYCVQEVSGDPPGGVAKHIRVLRPHIAIVTTIGGDHYTSFRSLEATAREKGQLVEKLPRHGTAILNADDPHVRAMADRTRAQVLMFGLSPDADIRATEVSSVWPDRLTLTVVHGHESLRVHTRLVGEHWTTSVLAAIACGIVCGIDLRTCAKVLEKFNPVLGRYSIHARSDGPVYVLDNRKASFWTIASGLDFVARAQAPRKTIVFGTISDYPGASSPRYRGVARQALEVADRVVFVGPNAGYVSKLRQGELQGRLFDFQTSYQASAFLAEEVLPEELIYIKASITDHLERIMLSQMDQVVCWRERCRRDVNCRGCRNYRKPHAPPFGLAESNPLLHSASISRSGIQKTGGSLE